MLLQQSMLIIPLQEEGGSKDWYMIAGTEMYDSINIECDRL